MMVKNR